MGLDLLAAGHSEQAIQHLRPLAAASPVPLWAQHAQCLTGAAFAMNGEVHSTEEAAAFLNRPANSAAQEAWKRVMPLCIQQLEAAAPRVPASQRAGVYYFLALLGADENEHVRHLREAVKLAPAFDEAAYQLGVHLLALGQLDEAAALFRAVSEKHPEWSEPRTNLGIVLNLSGRPQEAIREFREALKVRPDSANAHGQLGLALYVTGDHREALVECGRAVRAEPKDPFNHNCAAVVLIENERPADAVAYARRATELAPKHETFQVVLAAALAANGQPQEALAAMRRAVEIQPLLRSDPTRLEKANMLRGRALQHARSLLQKLLP